MGEERRDSTRPVGGATAGDAVTRPSPALTRGEYAVLAVAILVFVAIRFPLFTDPGVVLGWNSDAAIFGLMARGIAKREQFPIFFLGQSYMGPLTSWTTVVASIFTGGVTPLALRVAASAEVLAGIIFYWLALRRAFDRRVAAIVALWLAIGPAYMLRFVSAPIGAELFLLTGAIFWFSVRSRLDRRRHCFIFGLLAGFGWWMNQGVVFAIGATLVIAVLRSDWWRRVRPRLRIIDRLLFRAYRIDFATRLLLVAIAAVLCLGTAAGVLHDLGVPVPALFLYSPVAEPLTALVAFHLIVAFGVRSNRDRDEPAAQADQAGHQTAWGRLSLTGNALPFVAGALIAYLPVVFGRAGNVVPRTYGLSVPLLGLGDLVPHAIAVRHDAARFIGADSSITVALALVPFFMAAMFRQRSRIGDLLLLRPRHYGPGAIAAVTILLAAIFYLTSARAYPGAVRYIVCALPMLYAFTCDQMLRRRWVGMGAAIIVAAALAIPRIGEVRDVAAGRSERYGNFAGNFDPRPTLQRIESSGYRVCYANYWIAYKLEWLSGGAVAFVPFRSYDRMPARSRRLSALPLKKCFVTNEGAVRPLNPQDLEGETSRAARERLRRMNAGSESAR